MRASVLRVCVLALAMTGCGVKNPGNMNPGGGEPREIRLPSRLLRAQPPIY